MKFIECIARLAYLLVGSQYRMTKWIFADSYLDEDE